MQSNPAGPAAVPPELFRTARLRARRLDIADVDALHAVYGDAPAMRWVGDGQPLGRDDCVRWVEVTQRNYATRGYGMSAVELLAEQGRVIGFCGLVHPGGQAEAEIKYALLRAHWGRGYASEVAGAMLAYGAQQFGLRQVIATAAPDNLASHRVLQKAGMRQAQVRRNDDGTSTLVFAWQPGQSPPASA